MFLALATLLFVVSIYMYDRLSMPRRYWELVEDEIHRQDLWRSFRRDRVRYGLLYVYMVWVWRFVFSVAVAMAMLGFLALVLHRGVWPVGLLYLMAIAGNGDLLLCFDQSWEWTDRARMHHGAMRMREETADLPAATFFGSHRSGLAASRRRVDVASPPRIYSRPVLLILVALGLAVFGLVRIAQTLETPRQRVVLVLVFIVGLVLLMLKLVQLGIFGRVTPEP